MSSNPSYFTACGLDCPVEKVSWNDALTFIAKLNQLSGKNYRLPTEAEWEYAASVRTDGQKEKYSGGSDVAAVAWYGGNAGGTTHPVGGKLPNSRGLYDMSGNVWEWVSDWYGQYSNSDQTNPTGPASGTLKVGRGGGWNGGIADERSTRRDAGPPTVTMNSIGFRLAITNL
jgi:formylglycine-generating enzyme required for sulfatase activity